MATRPKALVAAYILQDSLLQCVAGLEDAEPTKRAALVAACARAWADVQERVRITKMQPAPKPVEVPAPGARRRQRRQASDELEPGAPTPAALPAPPKPGV